MKSALDASFLVSRMRSRTWTRTMVHLECHRFLHRVECFHRWCQVCLPFHHHRRVSWLNCWTTTTRLLLRRACHLDRRSSHINFVIVFHNNRFHFHHHPFDQHKCRRVCLHRHLRCKRLCLLSSSRSFPHSRCSTRIRSIKRSLVNRRNRLRPVLDVLRRCQW